MAPNIAKPTTKPTALVARKTRLRKSRRASTGSAARRSTRAKAMKQASASAPSATI